MEHWKKPPTILHKSTVMLGSWLIPGLGFWINGARFQAITMFILVEVLFLFGIIFSGGILCPATFNPFAANANIVGILTFIVQVFNGNGLVLSLLFPANESSALHDLGCFWLMVSSGLNYYAMLSIWDNFYAPVKPNEPESSAQEAK